MRELERTRLNRWIASVLIAIAFYVITRALLVGNGARAMGGDFTYPWIAARALLRGLNPYEAIRAAATPSAHVLFYPLPAALIALPLAGFAAPTAGALFVAVGSGLLAFALTKCGWWRLMLFASAPMYRVCWSVQWSPLLMASALLVPALGIVIAKPNFALPFFAFQSTRRAIWYGLVGAAALVLASFALQPNWVTQWIEMLRAAPASQYRIPILTRAGAVIALAALKWRRPEARLLFCMACMPQNGFYYDQLPVLLVPESRREMLVACSISVIVMLVPSFIPLNTGTTADISGRYIPLMVVGAYLPALIMVLRRPNNAPAATPD